MTNEIVILGPWDNYDNTEWLVTTYDELEDGEVVVTVDGEQVMYPSDSEYVAFFEESSGKRRMLGEKFVESDFRLMMEVREMNSSAIRVDGV